MGREGGSNSCQLLITNVFNGDKLMFEYELEFLCKIRKIKLSAILPTCEFKWKIE